jgi:hypothetical protein
VWSASVHSCKPALCKGLTVCLLSLVFSVGKHRNVNVTVACGSFPHEQQSTDVRYYATACSLLLMWEAPTSPPRGVTVLLRSNVLLVTMEIKSTSRCIATDIRRLLLMWEAPTDSMIPWPVTGCVKVSGCTRNALPVVVRAVKQPGVTRNSNLIMHSILNPGSRDPPSILFTHPRTRNH